MSALGVIIISLACFFLAYKFYAKRIERLWGIDPKRSTPAYAKYDSVDFVPAKNWLVLFGHHFASIAGAGPIIGPVLAVMLWGWAPALLWVILGTIFIGGVHDFGALIISVRQGGSSIADIAEQAISRKAKILFSIFVWLALILVIAVFAYLCADTFVKEPKIVAPSLGLIPVAIIVGYLLYSLRANLALVTVFGLVSLAGLIFLGNSFPVLGSLNVWLVVLFVYCYFASVTPVNIVLQPRDYLSSYLLFFSLILGYTGVFLSRPTINTPFYWKWTSHDGGNLWPALFVTVACGAVSGFHSLIASGTTSKQIANERHIKRVSYGGMIAEAVVAVLAIVVTAVLFKSKSDFASASGVSPITIFAKGYASITKGVLGIDGKFIAITTLNAFILTTLDTATRISRYLSEELFGIKNRYISTFFVIVLSAGLAFSGQWNKIWPIFGASNQLVAALALFVLSCWLLSRNKTMKFTLLPALFMLVTTLFSLFLQARQYFVEKNVVLFIVAILLIILAGFMVYEVSKVFRRKFFQGCASKEMG